MFESVKKLLTRTPQDGDDARDIARRCRALWETLESCNFFYWYLKLYDDVIDLYKKTLRRLNYDSRMMLESVKRYFGGICEVSLGKSIHNLLKFVMPCV